MLETNVRDIEGNNVDILVEDVAREGAIAQGQEVPIKVQFRLYLLVIPWLRIMVISSFGRVSNNIGEQMD